MAHTRGTGRYVGGSGDMRVFSIAQTRVSDGPTLGVVGGTGLLPRVLDVRHTRT
jgi:hypothetical protein